VSPPHDTAILGAGIMGASTALFLARSGMDCALLDRAGICREASGVNAGTLTLNMTRAALIPYALRGWAMWSNPLPWLGSDPGVVATDGLSLAFTDAEVALLESRAAARQERGADIRLLDGAAARRIEPGLSPHVLRAAHCPQDGHVTAYLTGRAYRQALVTAGVRLYETADVTGIDRRDGLFELRTGNDPIRARRLVLAGGVWLETMLGWLGVTIPIKTLVNQLIVTERMVPVMRSVLSVANGLLSLKQFANGTVLIGGGWQGCGDRESRNTALIPENLIGNVRLARYAIPALAGTRVVRAWAGFEAETADALPLIGPVPGVPQAHVIGSVHSGYTSGPYFGKLLAQQLLGREPELPLADFYPARLLPDRATEMSIP